MRKGKWLAALALMLALACVGGWMGATPARAETAPAPATVNVIPDLYARSAGIWDASLGTGVTVEYDDAYSHLQIRMPDQGTVDLKSAPFAEIDMSQAAYIVVEVKNLREAYGDRIRLQLSDDRGKTFVGITKDTGTCKFRDLAGTVTSGTANVNGQVEVPERFEGYILYPVSEFSGLDLGKISAVSLFGTWWKVEIEIGRIGFTTSATAETDAFEFVDESAYTDTAANELYVMPDLYQDYAGDAYWDGDRVLSEENQGSVTYDATHSRMTVEMPVQSDLRMWGREIYDHDWSAAKYVAVEVKNESAQTGWFELLVSDMPGDAVGVRVDTTEAPEGPKEKGSTVFLRSQGKLSNVYANNSGLYPMPGGFEGWVLIPVTEFTKPLDFGHILRVSLHLTWYPTKLTFGRIGYASSGQALTPSTDFSIHDESAYTQGANEFHILPDLYRDYKGDGYWDGQYVVTEENGAQVAYNAAVTGMTVTLPRPQTHLEMIGRGIYDYDLTAAKYMVARVKNELTDAASWFSLKIGDTVNSNSTVRVPEGTIVFRRDLEGNVTTAAANNSGLYAVPAAFDGYIIVPVEAYAGVDLSKFMRVSLEFTYYASKLTFGGIGYATTDKIRYADYAIETIDTSSIYLSADKVYDGTAAEAVVVGEELTDLTISYFETDDTPLDAAPVKAGTYKATATAKRGALDVTGETTFTIAKKALSVTVTLESNTIQYGQSPVGTLSYEGFIEGEDETAIVTAPQLALDSDLIGRHDLILTGGEAENYSFRLKEPIVVTVEGVLTGIEVTPPTKTAYFAGQTLDTTGMVVKAIYNDGSKVEVTGFAVDKTELDASDTTVTVTYEGKSATFAVTVTAVELTGIEVTPPTKTEYVAGEGLDTAGMVVTAVYNDGSKVEVTDFTVDTTTLAAGETTVTVTYQGKTATFTVTASEPERGCGCGSTAAGGAAGGGLIGLLLAGAALLFCRRKAGKRSNYGK